MAGKHTIHLAHDWLVGLRGGEQVLDRLAQRYGPTVLYTLVNDRRPLTPAIDACRVRTSPLQRIPGAAGRWRRWCLPLMPRAVERIDVQPCDLLLSTSSAVMKSIAPPDGTPHLCYCHSPARYIWGQAGDYAHGRAGRLRGAGLRAVRRRFREWDRRTASRVTRFLANSRHTAKKIAQFYGREAHVVPPPVRTGFFTPDSAVEREAWFLVVSAMEPYKRVDLAIRAANDAGFRLKVVGGGTQEKALRDMAGTTVEMLGRVSDEDLRGLYRRARALLHPQREDFGIIAVEAQACGCPVVAYAAGGALETVGEGCGVLFAEQTPTALADAVAALDALRCDASRIRANALRFSEAAFDEAIDRHVRDLLGITGEAPAESESGSAPASAAPADVVA